MDISAVVDEKLNIQDAFRIFKHGTSWAIIAIQICLGVPLQGVQLFLPVIIQRLGYSTVKTNLYTVAPNVSVTGQDGASRFIALGFLFTFIGMVIYAAIDVERDLSVAYFACFMMTWGTSAPSVLLDVWYNNNIASESRRVVLTSIAVPMANLMGVVASNIFRKQDAPKYIPALVTTAAFGGTGINLTLLLGLWMMMDNKKRDRAQGVHLKAKDIPTENIQYEPASADFRWFY
ncbi:uncharacterized protein N7477_006972 [Penicillium maclennaniae]|uniref:uncharacterized protein n=1 Tax=Penicillium maclennaniae TaxID=1343394 RepID=UPI002542646D|nr:uncharacterized protein N7477_006972 [Penicillium maclennaniae]KAJ5668402.1 hypothetical protein N7477_006972 [Penicillium maclennaniae]